MKHLKLLIIMKGLDGPEGSEIKSGLKKFKAGAKVHIIGAFYGTCEHIVVIGQHRHSGKYISCVIKVEKY